MSSISTREDAFLTSRRWRMYTAYLEYARRSFGELIGYCDVTCEKGHRVDGNIWYADQYLYPNHWQPGSKIHPKLVYDGQPKSWLSLWATTTLLRLGILLLFILLFMALI